MRLKQAIGYTGALVKRVYPFWIAAVIIWTRLEYYDDVICRQKGVHRTL